MLKIPHNALVFVGDGRKALFLRNHGDAKFPNLRTEKVFEEENPSTHEQGSDRPGRVSEAALAGRRSAVEPTDWHDIEEHRFARKVAAAMEQMVRASKVEGSHRCGSAKNARRIAKRIPSRREGMHRCGDKQGPDQTSARRN